jgi:hypothetical protein
MATALTNKDLINKVVQAKNAEINVRAFPSLAAKTASGASNILFTAKKGEPVGRSSGQYYNADGKMWVVVNLYKAVKLGTASRSYGYVAFDVAQFFTPTDNKVAETNAQNLMDNLVLNDKKLFTKLLTLNYLIQAAKAKGKNVTAIQTKFDALKKTYEARQTAMKNSTMFSIKTWNDSIIDKVYSFFGIGLEPITMLAIGAIVGIVALSSCYYLFKPHYDTSVVNLKTSDELEKALASLTPAESAKVKADLETQIDSAYNQGKTDQSTTGIFGNFQTIALIGAGAFIIMQLGSKPKSK